MASEAIFETNGGTRHEPESMFCPREKHNQHYSTAGEIQNYKEHDVSSFHEAKIKMAPDAFTCMASKIQKATDYAMKELRGYGASVNSSHDNRQPQRKTGSNWRWNMHSVEDDDDVAEVSALADFGLHQLASLDRDSSLPLDEHGARGYHAPLLNDDYQSQNVSPHNKVSPEIERTSSNEEHVGFVLLKRMRLLPKNEGWAAVSDLDAFFSSIYNYYYHRGLGAIVGKGVVELLSLFFTLWLSLFLFAYVDWNQLLQCNDESTCHASFFESYIIHRPFSEASFLNVWIVVYCLLFFAYGLFSTAQFVTHLLASVESKMFLEEVLGVSDRDLQVGTVEWSDIVERMSQAQRSGRCRVAILPRNIGAKSNESATYDRQDLGSNIELSTNNMTNKGKERDDGPTGHLVVAQRIMRRENFMISFFNRGLLDLTLPPFPSWLWPLSTSPKVSKEDRVQFFSKSIEWSIYFCVLNYMFNHSRKIRPAFYGDPSSLRRRFILCGLAHIVLMPFLLFFVTLHFFMLNIYEWQSTKEYLGPREWSNIARWTFQEFNELPHSFERRMEPSYKTAAAYLDMFGKPSPFTIAVGRILVFVSGSLGTLLLAFAAMNDAILLHVKIGQWNLLWYAGVLGACFSVGKGMLPKSASPHFGHARRNLFEDMDSALEKVAAHTHYLPDAWRGKGWDDRTKKTFSAMFQFKANHFAMEILSIIVAPLILCVSLPQCAESLCRYVRDSKVEVPGVGDVVGYSTFDFDSFSDENWTGKRSPSGFNETCQSSEEIVTKCDRPKTKHGKMEKSFFNFKSVYPNWKCLPSGQTLVNLVESFRHQQEIALARERRLHINAAAAQLETLRRLETEREKNATIGLAKYIDSKHVKLLSHNRDVGSNGLRPENTDNSKHSDTMSDFDSFGSLPDTGLHYPHTNIGESAHSFAPPSRAFTYSRSSPGKEMNRVFPMVGFSSYNADTMNSRALSSVIHYADAGLSTELKVLLNQSTLVDPHSSTGLYASDQSFTGSLIPIDEASVPMSNSKAEHQYMWLERYHSEKYDQGQDDRSQTERGE